MAQRYRTERDGNIDPGYWDPDVGGRQGQRDEGRDERRAERRDGAREDERQWSAGPRGQDRVQGRRPVRQSGQQSGAQQRSRSQDDSRPYDETAEGWRQAGYGGRTSPAGDDRYQSAPPDLEYDQGWHSNADWSGEGDAVPLYGRNREGGRRRRPGGYQGGYQGRDRGRADDEGNYLGQGSEQASGAYAAPWADDSDLFSRSGTRGYGRPREKDHGRSDYGHSDHGPGARGTEGRDWRGAQQTTGRDYYGARDYGGFVAPEHALGYADADYTRGRRTSPYSGSSAGYVTGDAYGDESWSGAFIGGTGRDYERGASGSSHRGPSQRGPNHRGKGPKGYARSADRIREEVCEWLSDDDLIDASEISVSCREGGVLVLEGTVDSMQAKHRAEMIADQCNGVREVDSRLRVMRPGQQAGQQHSGQQQAGQQQTGRQPSGGTMASASGAGATGGSESGSVGRQEQGSSGGSRTASSASMMAASRDAEQDRQKH